MTGKQAIRQALASGKTYAEVAGELGVSRQRVQQIISPRSKSLGVGICRMCGREAVLHRHHSNYNGGRYKALCVSCHRRMHRKATSNCPACGKETYRNHKYCSMGCYQKSRLVQPELVKVTCAFCGIDFERKKTSVEDRYRYKKNWAKRTVNYFCSKQCQGRWLGLNYGKGVQKVAQSL